MIKLLFLILLLGLLYAIYWYSNKKNDVEINALCAPKIKIKTQTQNKKIKKTVQIKEPDETTTDNEDTMTFGSIESDDCNTNDSNNSEKTGKYSNFTLSNLD